MNGGGWDKAEGTSTEVGGQMSETVREIDWVDLRAEEGRLASTWSHQVNAGLLNERGTLQRWSKSGGGDEE